MGCWIQGVTMQLWMLILCVPPTIVTTITISPNGNSPEAKMVSRIEAVSAKTISAMNLETEEMLKNKQQMTKSLKINSTQLAINERYRRLIPYMTFYYANDIAPPTTESYTNNVEVEKAEILEAGPLRPTERQPKIIYTQRHKDIPRYQGNRLTQFNIASSNPNKLYYKNVYPVFYQQTPKTSFNHRPQIDNRDNVYDGYIPKPIKSPSVPFTASQTRKPYYNLNQENIPNVQYYSSNEGEGPRYKLVPYEQTPPVAVESAVTFKKQYNTPITRDPVYLKEREPIQTYSQNYYDNNQQLKPRKPPTTVSEVYYERRPFVTVINEPVIESGFQPIANSPNEPTEVPVYTSTVHQIPFANFYSVKQPENQMVQPVSVASEADKYRYQYDHEKPIHHNEPHHQNEQHLHQNEQQLHKNELQLHQNEQQLHQNEQQLHQNEHVLYQTEQPLHQTEQHSSSNSVALADLLNSLQINKSIPKPITRENVGASIRTLLQVLNTLRAVPQHNEVETGIISTPKPFEVPEIHVQSTPHTIVATTARPQDTDIQAEPLLAPIHTPSQHLDEYSTGGGSSQRFPLPITSDEEGGTPGKPGVDYPILTIIPETSFDCKTQRYKGFFADPETRCQVWHYCDLNGGQASFLCPNGTIFSQAALTCDWWFNVRCSTTTQLYVLNESLYKYILPHSPKFPEDYSGPLVDKYLTLKFKEMEEQFRKNKNKKVEKMDESDDDDDDTKDSKERDVSSEESKIQDDTQINTVNQADVVVVSPGNSGNVQRLQDE